jgi:predicted O-methyltransferase YrrM
VRPYPAPALALKYLQYYFTASNSKGHGMHSPFVFDFINHVLNNRMNYRVPEGIERIRSKLLQDNSLIEVEDHGAGSAQTREAKRKISAIAATALKNKKYNSLFYRLVSHYKPNHIIELGTSLGLTTASMALANPHASITTVEGSASIAKEAGKTFSELALGNIDLLNAPFDKVLSNIITTLPQIDLVYIDGNHQLEPTLHYFNQVIPFVHNDTILVFDDIHWSSGMEEAWKRIRASESVRATIDIFFLGFVFFRAEFREKQNFTIRF